ncbi:hypothetical protein F441_20729 [Phytophthora nicotianae CJ01A1]|uniref:Uncharacterized protein n=6 Tax=Phytophthora nicotianae TaxID=4792 RepID=W2PJM4_PHYN3|nr:hypothetical protein PPTG_24296 [Phytophthora nicotianae INRA-310]ETI32293.1 hypothetical protein F443_20866 [Phytophthora nicotianae P1569]ETK72665.1 hypothetical protein L915_20282 [Phytophthora nicotianae]ETO61024.1 hypothetical protein F444_20889 [Phytophthora nicotianae P1976]ETP02172.1 hypothetical protein F441_20729 [Phytophthora nicotianae CJ01A1]ETP30317.1 hypothetical protein F442_20665 [Phytophthora nicotianae P10297]
MANSASSYIRIGRSDVLHRCIMAQYEPACETAFLR